MEYNLPKILKLSNEFSTDNIISETLKENDVFKNINYIITIDNDAKYIGKYNLIDNLTKYNLYKKNNNPLKKDLENIILNKILLIKSIKEEKYNEADIYNKKINELELDYNKKEKYNLFDSNRDGSIDTSEIINYQNKNHKLSEPGYVEIKSVIFDGVYLNIVFDKNISNNDTIKIEDETDIELNNTDLNKYIKLFIDGKEEQNYITNYDLINDHIIKITLNNNPDSESKLLIDKMKSYISEIKIPNTIIFKSDKLSPPSKKNKIRRKLIKTNSTITKTINNFSEFDSSIFGV